MRRLSRPGAREVILSAYKAWTDDELEAVMRLADLADARRVSLIIRAPHPDACFQIDLHRLHRRVLVEGRNLEALDSFRTCEPPDSKTLEDLVRFRNDPELVLTLLAQDPIEDALAIFEQIVRAEDHLYSMNLVRPYRDLVPIVLRRLDPKRTAMLLESLSPGYAVRVLCDDYTRVSPVDLGTIVRALSPEFSTRVIRTMLHGADRPRRLAAIIQRAGSIFAERLLPRLEARELLPLIDAAESHWDAEWVVKHLSDEAAGAMLEEARETESNERFQKRAVAFRCIRDETKTASDPRQPGWHRPSGVDTFHPALGRRVVQDVDGGRWIHIEEVTQGPFGLKRIVADVLEFDPFRGAAPLCLSASLGAAHHC